MFREKIFYTHKRHISLPETLPKTAEKKYNSPRHLNNLCERIKNVVFNFDQSIYFSVTPTCKINMIYRTNLKQICEESLGGHLPAAPTLNLPAGLLLPLF